MGNLRKWVRSFTAQPGTPAELSGGSGIAGMIAETAEEEIGCEEVYDLLDQYAEITARGEDPAVLLPLVMHHLRLCICCRQELEALLRILQAEPR